VSAGGSSVAFASLEARATSMSWTLSCDPWDRAPSFGTIVSG
jgi:hypothetical protein